MKFQTKTLLITFLLVSLGCTREDLKETFNPQNEESIVETTLYPRRTDAPVVLFLPSKEEGTLRVGDTDLEPYMFFAKSYAPEGSIPNSVECFRRPVFDVSRLVHDDPEVLSLTPIRRMEARYFSFTNTSSYENHIKENSTKTMKWNVGILKLFSMGTKKTISESFKKDYTESNTNVYSIASISYDYGRYWFSSDALTRREIRWNYLNKRFLNDLYGSPLAETFGSKYGVLIADQFLVGANAQALFYGSSENARSQRSQESAMDRVIRAGLNIPLDEDTLGVNFRNKAGFNWRENTVEVYGFSSIDVVYRTNGGKAQSTFAYPKSIDNFSVDFSPWFASLKGPEDFTITRTEQFKSLSEYVIEENFKQRINKRYFNIEMRVPFIGISNGHYRRDFAFVTPPTKLYVTLLTRYGDEILLRPIHSDDDSWWTVHSESEFNDKATQLASILKDCYNLQIIKSYRKQNVSDKLTPLPRINNFKPYPEDYCAFKNIIIPFYGMNEMKMTKCYHHGYNMEFLLYDGGKGRQYAFAIYDKSFIGTYGLEKIYQRAPLVDFPAEYIIDNYVVVGL